MLARKPDVPSGTTGARATPACPFQLDVESVSSHVVGLNETGQSVAAAVDDPCVRGGSPVDLGKSAESCTLLHDGSYAAERCNLNQRVNSLHLESSLQSVEDTLGLRKYEHDNLSPRKKGEEP